MTRRKSKEQKQLEGSYRPDRDKSVPLSVYSGAFSPRPDDDEPIEQPKQQVANTDLPIPRRFTASSKRHTRLRKKWKEVTKLCIAFGHTKTLDVIAIARYCEDLVDEEDIRAKIKTDGWMVDGRSKGTLVKNPLATVHHQICERLHKFEKDFLMQPGERIRHELQEVIPTGKVDTRQPSLRPKDAAVG